MSFIRKMDLKFLTSLATNLRIKPLAAMKKSILSANTTFAGFGMNPMFLVLKDAVKKMDKDYENNSNIKWNFTKFLIDREGRIVARFESTEDMEQIKTKVEGIL